MQTMLTVPTVSDLGILHGRPEDRVAIRPALWLACFLRVRDLSGRLLHLLQMMLRR
jgi:hypothetical protein